MTAAEQVPNRPTPGTIYPMRTRTDHLPTWAEPEVQPAAKRLNVASAALLVLALICASATVAFGIWMTAWAQHL